MPDTPALWLSEFTANLTTTNNQSTPRITQLANGTILVTWTSNDPGGVGSPAGFDVIGQFFDPLGTRIGAEFLVNSTFTANFERDADVAALANGGFVAVYEDFSSGTNGAIRLTQRDAAGAAVRSVTIEADTVPGGSPTYADARVAVSSATSALVVFREFETNGDTRILGRIYDPATGTVGAQISLLNTDGQNGAIAVAVLGNGNYVIACASFASATSDSVISYRIVNASGGNVLGSTQISDTISGPGFLENTPSVTALTGGGFVIAWGRGDLGDDDILVRIFSASGVEQGSAITLGSAGQGDDNLTPSVVALADGSFVVLWDNNALGTIQAQHVSAAGLPLGDEMTVAAGSGTGGFPDAQLLGDGRIAVTFVNAAGEVGLAIIDTRDVVNDPPVYTGGGWQVGTPGDDVFTADNAAFTVAGGGGDDTITGGTENTDYFLGTGNDLMIVSTGIGFDNHDGGDGQDTIDWSVLTTSGNSFNLATGLASIGINSEAMTGFEHLIGSGQADNIVGTSGDNSLSGGGGDDSIDGGDGADTLFGGDGFDTLIGGQGDDLLFGGIEDDVLVGGDGDDSFIVALGDGFDDVFGEADTDLFNLSALDQDVDVNLATELWESQGFMRSVAGIENVTTGGGNDTITGSDVANRLNGGDGNDTITGGGGADTVFGGDGDDVITTTAAGEGDSNFGGTGNDTFVLSNSFFTGHIHGDAGTDDHADASAYVGFALIADLVAGSYNDGGLVFDMTGIEHVTGGSGDDVFTGDDAANRLTGNAGNDSLTGGGGVDTITGGTGADSLDGGADIDTLSYAGSALGVTVFLALNTAAGGDAAGDTITGFENLIGSGQNDTLVGTSGDNVIDGAGGDDVIQGFTGTDTLRGGAGNDTIAITTFDPVTAGSVFDGGTDSDTFIVGFNTATTSVTLNDFAIQNFETLRIQTEFAGPAVTASISASGFAFQFTAVEIAHVAATAATLAITMGGEVSLDLSTRSFTGFTLPGDRVVVTGDGDAETITGSSVNDVITGNGGADTITGGAGADSLDGGAGTDTLSYAGSAAGVNVFLAFNSASGGDAAGDTITGFENLIGSGQGDQLIGTTGGNVIDGAGGDDFIQGFTGTDTLRGGAGNDAVAITTLDPATAGSVFDGGADSDAFRIQFNSATTSVTLNDFTIQNFETLQIQTLSTATAVTASISASAFAQFTAVEIVHASANAATLAIGMGDMATLDLSTRTFTGFTLPGDRVTVTGDGDSETITGSSVNDVINGNGGLDSLSGGGGNDTIIGGVGRDDLFGDGGDDTFVVDRRWFDDIYGGTETTSAGDTADFSATRSGLNVNLGAGTYAVAATTYDLLDIEQITLGNGRDTVTGSAGFEIIHGGGKRDQIDSGLGSDQVFGDGGNDVIIARLGTAATDGGTDIDTLDFSALIAGINFNMATGVSNLIGTHTNYESVVCGSGNDTITGGDNNEVIRGNNGNDQVFGGRGADDLFGLNGTDTLSGGAGNDTLTGGAFADHFVFARVLSAGSDLVTDFGKGADRLDLDDALWTGVLTTAQVVTTFAHVVGGDVVFDFGNRGAFTLAGITSLAGLDALIDIF